jgi:hypothetical protein
MSKYLKKSLICEAARVQKDRTATEKKSVGTVYQQSCIDPSVLCSENKENYIIKNFIICTLLLPVFTE